MKLLARPPRIKVLEAAGCIGDNRVKIVDSSRAVVSSSTGERKYRVILLEEGQGVFRAYSDDNGTVYKGYVGYPIIAFMGTNCTSEPFRASTGVSPGFTLPPPRSPGFWSHGSDSGPFGTPPLAALRRLRACRFPYAYGALTPLGSPLPWTPRPVFQDGRHDPGPPALYSRVAPVSFGGLHSFRAVPYVAARFQALFTPLAGCFSAFPHGT